MRAWRIAQRSTYRSGDTFTKRGFSTATPRWTTINTIAQRLRQDEDAEDITVKGWIRSVRKQKRVAFAAVSDGSTIDSLQAVLKPEDGAELSTGTAVTLSGSWKSSPGSKQSRELQVSAISIEGNNDVESNPLQPKYQTPEYLRTIPHLRPRIPSNALLLRLRSELITALATFFNKNDFIQTHTPIVTSSDCEGAGEVFTVDANASTKASSSPKSNSLPDDKAKMQHFFRTPKYLTVSAQLHLEALTQAVNRVWTLSPTFRAEESDTPRHLSEFYMLEAEMGFCDDLGEIMDLVEGMLRSAVDEVYHSRTFDELLRLRSSDPVEGGASGVDAKTLQQRWNGLIAPSWPRITYSDAIDVLLEAHSTGKQQFAFEPSYDAGLHAEHERYLATTLGKGTPVFVTHYPLSQKPFYMLPSNPNSTSTSAAPTAACFDLLLPEICELAGGSLREHRHEELAAAMKAKGVSGENLNWYLDLRKFGSVPHGGFGLGFDRLVGYLGGVGNVRDVVGFPRWVGRCEC